MINMCDIYESILFELNKQVLRLIKNAAATLKAKLYHTSAIEFFKIINQKS